MEKQITTITVILVLVFYSPVGFGQQEVSPPPKAVTAAEGTGTNPKEAEAKSKETERVPVQKEEWQFFVAPYMWIPGMNVNTTLLGQTTTVSLGWYDMVPRLFSNVIGAMGRFEAWKGRWGIYVDSYFTYLGASSSDNAGKTIDLGQRLHLNIPLTLQLSGDLKFISRAANVDFGPRYLVGTVPLKADKPLPLLSFEVIGGGRYNFYNQYIKLALNGSLTGAQQTRTVGGVLISKVERSFLEPFLGMRLGLWINPKMVALVRFTVGGFGLASENNLDLDMELDLGYRLQKNIYAYAGWRARYEQFSQNVLSLNAWFNGPILGAVFAF
jgi:hypothetical protein